MENSVICKMCQTENPGRRTLCQQCGAPLVPLLTALSTEPVPQKAVEATPPQQAVEVPQLRGQGIALVIRGHETPVLIEGRDILLGRYDPGSAQPSVDLTPFNASALGVSRRHARIQIQNDVFLIEDLNSTNGTWVNQKRLPAGKQQGLQNGDLIQLGQLVLHIYFDAASALRSVEERISFKTHAATLTPHYLATCLSPYLTALAAVQAVCDEVLRREPSAIEISSISSEGPALITVQVAGAREALRLAKGPLKTWRQDNAARINQFITIKDGLGRRTGVLMESGESVAAQSSDEELARQLGRQLRESEVKLAFDFLREIAPQYSGEDRREYVEKLIRPLHVLAFSPLHVTTGSQSLAH